MAITKSLDGGGTTSTIEYEPSVVYANVATDKVPAHTFDDATFTEGEVGSRYSAPSSHDGEDIVVRRSPRSFSITADGTSGQTTQTNLATTTTGAGTGLTLDVTAEGGVATALAVNTRGFGYRVGDEVTITAAVNGGGADIDAIITLLD